MREYGDRDGTAISSTCVRNCGSNQGWKDTELRSALVMARIQMSPSLFVRSKVWYDSLIRMAELFDVLRRGAEL